MDYMVLRWDGTWAKYNNVESIKHEDGKMIIKEKDVQWTYYEDEDDIKEFGVITLFTKSYFEDNLRYQ